MDIIYKINSKNKYKNKYYCIEKRYKICRWREGQLEDDYINMYNYQLKYTCFYFISLTPFYNTFYL